MRPTLCHIKFSPQEKILYETLYWYKKQIVHNAIISNIKSKPSPTTTHVVQSKNCHDLHFVHVYLLGKVHAIYTKEYPP